MKKRMKKKIPRSLRRLFPQIKECVDSTSPHDVFVTAGDCKNARKMEGDACAMARAVVRQEKADGALIGMAYSYIIKGDKATRYQTSHAIGREITSFDRHEDFQPGEYRLSAVSPSQRLGKRPSGPRGKDTGGHEKGRKVHKETVNVRSFRRAG